MMQNVKWIYLTIILTVTAMWLFIILLNDTTPTKTNKPSTSTKPQVVQQPPKPSELHLMAVGDIMMHEPQIVAGKTASGYNFDSFFEHIAHVLEPADFAFGNLETTLAGEAARYAGYPMFNAPDELADALKKANFDVITTANNHSLDRFEKGLLRTIEQLDRVNLLHTGTFASPEERDKPLIIEKNDIKLGVLAYTYSTNGVPIPQGKPYLINMIDKPLMAADIKNAKQAGVDLVVIAIHFGPEYWTKPNDEQKQIVDFLFESGADIILGSHPHVVQPYEVREWLDDNDQPRQGIVIYSLGNFISNQRDQPRDIGGILSIKIRKQNGATSIIEHEFIPTYVHRYESAGKRVYNVLPMAETIAERDYPPFRASDYAELEKRYKNMMEHVISAP
jgi:poly-gamma-glutamate synthesis protein (capsule biosynthesis protein)